MAVSHLGAQKTSPNFGLLVCVLAFTCRPTCPLLLVSHRSNVISWYSIFIRTHTVSPGGFMGGLMEVRLSMLYADSSTSNHVCSTIEYFYCHFCRT